VSRTVLGAVLAGGRSRRFGAPKARATVGGRPLVERAFSALREVVPEVLVVANDPAMAAGTGGEVRPDAIPGGGPLSGIHTALRWAAERGGDAALCVATDMPFLSPALLRALLRRALETEAPIVAPEGPDLAPEPLCALYSTACLPEIEVRLGRGERALRALLSALGAERLPLAEVRRWGDPALLFLNVNTPQEHRRAEHLLSQQPRHDVIR
jgi:molybdopterin-guanine dinucleotide biosynthesis protein A